MVLAQLLQRRGCLPEAESPLAHHRARSVLMWGNRPNPSGVHLPFGSSQSFTPPVAVLQAGRWSSHRGPPAGAQNRHAGACGA